MRGPDFRRWPASCTVVHSVPFTIPFFFPFLGASLLGAAGQLSVGRGASGHTHAHTHTVESNEVRPLGAGCVSHGGHCHLRSRAHQERGRCYVLLQLRWNILLRPHSGGGSPGHRALKVIATSPSVTPTLPRTPEPAGQGEHRTPGAQPGQGALPCRSCRPPQLPTWGVTKSRAVTVRLRDRPCPVTDGDVEAQRRGRRPAWWQEARLPGPRWPFHPWQRGLQGEGPHSQAGVHWVLSVAPVSLTRTQG